MQHQRLTRQSVLGAILAVWCGLVAVPAQAQLSWDYSPYRLTVWVALETAPELTESMYEEIRQTLQEQADVHVGAPWDVVVQPAPPQFRYEMVNHIERIEAAEVIAADEEILESDKLYLLSVDWSTDRFTVRCREMDCRTRYWGRLQQQEVFQQPLVADTAFAAFADAFTPLTRVEQAEGKWSQVRLRAGGLILRDDSLAMISLESVLLPITRRNDRVGQPLEKGILVVPWTYLIVDERKGSVLTCQVHSGIRNAISGRSSSRTQRYALLARPTGDTTRLIITAKNDPDRRMAGYDVYSKEPERPAPLSPPETEPPAGAEPEPPADEDEDEADAEEAAEPPPTPKKKKTPPELIGRSDWRGIVDVPLGKQSLRVLYIRNGGRLLARLPTVPGLFESVTVEIPDDDLRLEAESFVASLRSKILDLVARRAVLASMVRRRIADKQLDKAEELMREFRALETRADISAQMDQEQQRFATSDPSMMRKIDALFSDTRTILGKFVEDKLMDDLNREVSDAK